MKYSIIIPCYNEEENIPDLVRLLEEKGAGLDVQWILVENGSKDGTGKALETACRGKKTFNIAYVEENQGYGYGLIEGMKKAEGDYIGWLHADMQVSPDYMVEFIEKIEALGEAKVFLKGKRKNRSLLDNFFTSSMTVIATVLLKTYLFDIGAIPVLFPKSLLEFMDKPSYDFSIETYVYYVAKKQNYRIERIPVDMSERQKGESSWNKGLRSKIKQSKVIMKDLVCIRKGRQVR